MRGYKGFKKDLRCKGKQYSENSTIFEEDKVEICKNDTYFCRNPFNVWMYYPPCDKNGELNEFAEIETLDEVKTNNNVRFRTSKLQVTKKLSFVDFVKIGIKTALNDIKNNIKTNTHSYSAAINTDNFSVAINKGERSTAINTGECSVAKNVGECSTVTSTGDHSVAIGAGCCSTATNTGLRSVTTNEGYSSIAANTGYGSTAINAGNCSIAVNTGINSTAIAKGKNSVAIVAGRNNKVKGVKGNWIVCIERDQNDNILCIKTAEVDGKRIREDVFYTVKNGEFVEVN